MEYWSHGVMEKSSPGLLGWLERFFDTYLNLIMLYYIQQINDHIAKLSKTRSIHCGKIFIQHSNTPALIYLQNPLFLTCPNDYYVFNIGINLSGPVMPGPGKFGDINPHRTGYPHKTPSCKRPSHPCLQLLSARHWIIS